MTRLRTLLPKKWSDPCGCPGHGDHLGCSDACHRLGCTKPYGKDPVHWEWRGRTLPRSPLAGTALSVYIEPRDLWVGAYIAPHAVYVCPLPTVVFRWPRPVRTPGPRNAARMEAYCTGATASTTR